MVGGISGKWVVYMDCRLQIRNCPTPVKHVENIQVCNLSLGFPGDTAVKNHPANAGDLGSIPGLGGSLGEGNGSPLQCSCLENPMDRGAWGATVPGVARVGRDSVTKTHTLESTAIAPCARSRRFCSFACLFGWAGAWLWAQGLQPSL